MELTKEQKKKINQTIELLGAIAQMDENSSEIIGWLLMAGDYCREVVEELRDDKDS